MDGLVERRARWLLLSVGLAVALLSCSPLGRGGSSGGSESFGVMTGHLSFTPALLDADIATVDAVGSSQTTTPGTVSPNGDYTIFPLTADTYTVTATCPGYSGSSVVGVSVTAGADTQVPTIQMASIGSPDAG